MPVPLRLALRELRGGVRGFRIFLACLALGVATIAAAGSIGSAVESGLASDARRLLGGDLDFSLIYRPIPPEARARLDEMGEVSAQRTLRVMAGNPDTERRALAELKTVDDAYPLIGQVVLDPAQPLAEALARRDGLWGAVADPALLTRLDAGVGDVLTFGQARVEVRAALVTEPDRVASVTAFGPRLMTAQPVLEESGLILPGSLITHGYRLALPPGRDPGQVRRDLEAEFPDLGWRIRGLDRAAPGLQRMMDRVTLFLTLVGLTALLVGGIGVANAVKAHLDGRAETIATLKCLGASRAQVGLTYLIQIGLLGGLGIVIGLGLGALAPLAAQGLAGDLLPVKAGFALYPGPLALAALFGALTGVTFSLLPLLRAQVMPGAALFRDAALAGGAGGHLPWPMRLAPLPFAALLAGLTVLAAPRPDFALGFVVAAVGGLVIFRLAGEAVSVLARRVSPGAGRPGLRLAVANLHRPGAATVSVLLSLGLGLTVLVTVAQIEGNLKAHLLGRLPERAPAFFFIDLQPDQMPAFRDLLETTGGVELVSQAPMIRGRVVALNGAPVEIDKVAPDARWAVRGDRGLTTAAAPPANLDLTAGQWWPEDYAGPPLISLADGIAEGLGVGVGDTIDLNILGRTLTGEIASLRRVDWSSLSMNFSFILSPGALEGAPATWIATVTADGPAAEDRLEKAVAEPFPNVSAIRVRQALESVNTILAAAGQAIRMAAAVALVAGALVLAGAIAAGHRRRLYDSVVLKVLGATRGDLTRAYALEYGLLGAIAGLLAAGLGTGAAALVTENLMSVPFTFLPTVTLTTVAGAGLLTLAVGFAGTFRALNQPAAPLLKNE